MNLSEKQSQEVYEFMMKYNTDEEFKNHVQHLYDSNIYKLSILQIYALEEVLRYGTKGIFNKFLNKKGVHTEEQIIDLYDEFMNLLISDDYFKQYKMQQLKDSPESLSEIELFAFTLIGNSEEKKQQMHADMTKDLEYDPYNLILYSTDNQIRETLENLFFGEFIYQVLEQPSMKPIKVRQKEPGRIANIDKPFIIEKIQSVVFKQSSSISQLKRIIDNRFCKVKMDVLLGKGEEAFEQYLKFNTNISASEILGTKKDYFDEDIYNYFMDIINKRKAQENERRKK